MTVERPRALVTGASGFAGRHLCRLLLSEGWAVAGTVYSRSARLKGLLEHRVGLDDMNGLEALVREFNPEVVYHLAAIVDTVTTPDNMLLYRTNVLGTAGLLRTLGASSATRRVLLASSSFAYGRTALQCQPVKESTPLNPVTPYGASKAAAEAIALAWGRETWIDVVVTRAFQHTGPGHVGAYAVPDWASQLAAGERTLRVRNIDVQRDYLDVRDVATAYRDVMYHGHAGEVYNVASGVPLTMRSLLEGLLMAFDSDATVEVDESRLRPNDPTAFYGDVTRILQHTDWRPTLSLTQTLLDLAGERRAQE